MTSTLHCTKDHLARARELVALAHSHDGLASLDLHQFYHHNVLTTRDQRGLLFATAGSINNGSLLSGLRLIMAAIQRFRRYNN